MNNKNFVIHKIKGKQFFKKKEDYVTEARSIKAAGGAKIYTNVKFSDESIKVGKNNSDILEIIDIVHGKIIKVDGKWNNSYIDEAIKEIEYKVYYSLSKNIFISNVEKSIAYDAIKQLGKNSGFKIEKLTFTSGLKLRNLTARIKGINSINNVQFNMEKADPEIKRGTFTGGELAKSPYVKSIKNKCTVKSISLIIKDNNKGAKSNKKLKVKISGNGWVFFYEDYQIDTCLEFILYLINKKIFK